MTGPGGSGDFIQLPKSVLVWAMARSVGIVVAYLAAYFVVPWTVLDGWGEVVVVAAFLVVAALTAVWQIGRILRARRPRSRRSRLSRSSPRSTCWASHSDISCCRRVTLRSSASRCPA